MEAFGMKAIEWLGNGDSVSSFVNVSIVIAIFFIISAVITVRRNIK